MTGAYIDAELEALRVKVIGQRNERAAGKARGLRSNSEASGSKYCEATRWKEGRAEEGSSSEEKQKEDSTKLARSADGREAHIGGQISVRVAWAGPAIVAESTRERYESSRVMPAYRLMYSKPAASMPLVAIAEPS